LVATVGDAKSFKNARQVPAWLGMVPRHEGTGGKVTPGGISKRGDVYLRTLLIHGARSVIAHIEYHPNHADDWSRKLLTRRNKNVAAVALAAKNARIAWALLAHERSYQHDYVATRKAA
jgi:transposase